VLSRVLVAVAPCDLRLHEEDPQEAAGLFRGPPAAQQPVGFLLLLVAKSLALQLRGRVSGRTVSTECSVEEATAACVGGCWLPGRVDTAQSILLVELLAGLQRESRAWRSAVQEAILAHVSQLRDLQKRFAHSSTHATQLPELWLALASLAVVATQPSDEVQRLCGQLAPASAAGDSPTKRTCDNHDDQTTRASVHCHECASNLCPECDRFLHLSKVKRSHQRKALVDEKMLQLNVSESCARAKLSSLLVVVDPKRSKAVVQYKPSSTSSAICRFCEAAIERTHLATYVPASPALALVCGAEDCQEKASSACTRTHSCGHPCGGVRDELDCPACPCASSVSDEVCRICLFTLQSAPMIHLDSCAHSFHYHCLREQVERGFSTARITFGHLNCPLCRTQVQHPSLTKLLQPFLDLREDVVRKSELRLQYMNLTNDERIASKYDGDKIAFALDTLCYYKCFKCSSAYFGGVRSCEAEAEAAQSDRKIDRSELVCGACSAGALDVQICPLHGKDYLGFKCRYCCSPSIWFCFGTTHFCDTCHNDHSRLTSTAKEELVKCPAGPGNKPLDDVDECPLGLKDCIPGEERALGCSICRNAQTF